MFTLRKITRPRIKAFLSQHASDDEMLDIGSGDDYYSHLFPNKINVDIDPARKPDIVGDIHALPFEDERFDGILAVEVLEHVVDPQKAVSEMFRVLRPGGKLILTTRFIFPIHDAPGDYFRYTKYGMKHLFKNWDITSLEEETASFEALAVLLQRLILQAKYRGNKVVKAGLMLLIKLMYVLNRLLAKEYGNIKQTTNEQHILTSGYYLIAHKPK